MNSRSERNRLSQREEEVLRLAANGQTDQQIANALNIRVSTVTTYWVRIRGKVGQLSRAELIAQSVRQRSQELVNELRSENLRLKDELASNKMGRAEALPSIHILRECLDQIQTPMLVVRPEGRIAVVNKSAERSLARTALQLEQMSLDEVLSEPKEEDAAPLEQGSRMAVLERPTNVTRTRLQLQVRPLDGPAAGWALVTLERSGQ